MAIITLIERSQIELMQHHTIQYIAATLGRSRISIRHELHRCPEGDYCAIIAQDHADTCRHRCGRHSILTPKLKRMVTEKLNLGWSPEMVGYAVHCAPHTIYHWIYQRQVDFQPSQLFDHGKRHKRRQDLRSRYNQAVGTSIEIRSESANRRTEKGHLEMDTVRGKIGRSGLVSLVDRKSRYLLSERVPKVNAKNVTQAMIDLLHTVTPKRVRTLTPDRGTEFAGYREVGKELGISVYFPDPHAPQQRGTNENTNGLIREYFPKGTDLDELTDQDIAKFVRDLNNRPRKVLGWKTPSEVFFGKKLHLI
ncbi:MULTISPECIES: IS30 family transposase [Bacillati]|uniref:Transposase n=1 Tax=Bifidobacterium mongoliense TaxID=518643 RepID=A0A423UC39_9BIFI|nr:MULTISPECIES: IS30 family transposase [Terrabacteria group]ROT86251.1 transposase [Bifidobacterium mongoliense]WEB10744.1 IS30 family transposase [Lacticaseibacillus rhamnosus]